MARFAFPALKPPAPFGQHGAVQPLRAAFAATQARQVCPTQTGGIPPYCVSFFCCNANNPCRHPKSKYSNICSATCTMCLWMRHCLACMLTASVWVLQICDACDSWRGLPDTPRVGAVWGARDPFWLLNLALDSDQAAAGVCIQTGPECCCLCYLHRCVDCSSFFMRVVFKVLLALVCPSTHAHTCTCTPNRSPAIVRVVCTSSQLIGRPAACCPRAHPPGHVGPIPPAWHPRLAASQFAAAGGRALAAAARAGAVCEGCEGPHRRRQQLCPGGGAAGGATGMGLGPVPGCFGLGGKCKGQAGTQVRHMAVCGSLVIGGVKSGHPSYRTACDLSCHQYYHRSL